MSDSLKPISMNVKRNTGSLSLYSTLLLVFVLLNTVDLAGQPGHKRQEIGWLPGVQPFSLWSHGTILLPRDWTDNSLRQIVRVSIGGTTLRVRLSNEFSKAPVTMRSVQIAASAGQGVIDEFNKRKTYIQWRS